MPTLSYDHSIDLAAERLTMRAWKQAMRKALLVRPVTDSPTLSVDYPAAHSLFHAVDAHAASLPLDDGFRRAWEDVVEFIRNHPDIDAFKPVLGVDDLYIDDVFREAMAIQGQW